MAIVKSNLVKLIDGLSCLSAILKDADHKGLYRYHVCIPFLPNGLLSLQKPGGLPLHCWYAQIATDETASDEHWR